MSGLHPLNSSSIIMSQLTSQQHQVWNEFKIDCCTSWNCWKPSIRKTTSAFLFGWVLTNECIIGILGSAGIRVWISDQVQLFLHGGDTKIFGLQSAIQVIREAYHSDQHDHFSIYHECLLYVNALKVLESPNCIGHTALTAPIDSAACHGYEWIGRRCSNCLSFWLLQRCTICKYSDCSYIWWKLSGGRSNKICKKLHVGIEHKCFSCLLAYKALWFTTSFYTGTWRFWPFRHAAGSEPLCSTALASNLLFDHWSIWSSPKSIAVYLPLMVSVVTD